VKITKIILGSPEFFIIRIIVDLNRVGEIIVRSGYNVNFQGFGRIVKEQIPAFFILESGTGCCLMEVIQIKRFI